MQQWGVSILCLDGSSKGCKRLSGGQRGVGCGHLRRAWAADAEEDAKTGGLC